MSYYLHERFFRIEAAKLRIPLEKEESDRDNNYMYYYFSLIFFVRIKYIRCFVIYCSHYVDTIKI